MKEPLRFCKEECNKEVTLEDILNDKDCGFCDVPYALNSISELDNFDELMINKEQYEETINDYKENIRRFFEYYKDDSFNGVVNTFEINFNPHPLYIVEIILGWQRLPLQAINDFCEVFDYYLPTIDYYTSDDDYKFNYTFRKKKK